MTVLGKDRADTASRNDAARGTATTAAAGVGAALVATAVSACCTPVIAPLVVSLLGASGAALAAGLRPYSPYLLGGSAVLLGYGFHRLYRSARRKTGGCVPPSVRGTHVTLWTATVLWVAALMLNVTQR